MLMGGGLGVNEHGLGVRIRGLIVAPRFLSGSGSIAPEAPARIHGFDKERWQSGRMYLTRNQAYRKVPRVRIPPSPPEPQVLTTAPTDQWAFLFVPLVQR